MMQYSSGLVSESFWFVECKKVIQLRDNGMSWDEIKTMCIEDNLLGISKEYRAKRIFGYIKNRLNTLDDKMIKLFMDSDLSTQKIMILIAIAKQNTLFFEFLFESYRESVILGTEELTNSQVNIFFKNKQDQYEDVSNWTDVTLKRLGSAYMNFMVDAGLLTVINKRKHITPRILDAALERYLKDNGDIHMIKAVTGVG